MKKIEYLQSLLDLCTEEQVSLFERIYPSGPSKSQLSRAITQVKTTLRNVDWENNQQKNGT